MEQDNSIETSGDCQVISGETPQKPSIFKMKDVQSTLPASYLAADINKGGALQQLTEFLNHHAKADTLNDFKGNTPTIPINDLRGDDAARYSREERLHRCQLASLCRLIDLNGWTQSIYNHLSAKCAPGQYLVNPFGLLFHEVQASTLVKVDAEGNLFDAGSTVLGVNKAGWILHSAVHSARSDINCVVHIHLPDVVAVSCIKSGLLSTSPEAAELLNSFGVNYHEYCGFVMDETEADAIRKDLVGKTKILFLRNKGVVIAANSIHEAWYLVKRVITACQTQMRLLQLGGGAALLTELTESISGLADSGALSGSGQFSARPFDCLLDDTTNDAKENVEDVENTNTNGVKEENHTISNGGGHKTSSSSVDIIWGVGEMDFEAQMRMLDSAGFRTGHLYRNPNLLRRQPGSMPWSDNTRTGTSVDFFNTTDMSGGEISGVDDVTAANSAGAAQMAKIAVNVRVNKEKSTQRQQFLTRKEPVPVVDRSQCIDVNEIPQLQSTPFSSQSHPIVNGNNKSSDHMLQLDINSVKSTPTKKSKKKKGSKHHQNGHPDCEIIEPHTPPTPRGNTASRSASLPAHARNLVNTLPPRTSNTLETIDGTMSEDEELIKAGKKPKGRFRSFRFPTFKKKKQTLPSPQGQAV